MPEFNFDEEAQLTNTQFADEIAKLTTLKNDEIARLFPTKVDKERLVELMKIVKSSASRNTKAARLEQNISNLGGAVVKVLGLLV